MVMDRYKPLLERDFLLAEFHYEFEDYKAEGEDERLLALERTARGRV